MCAAKAKAIAATNTFLAKKKPHFTIINLMRGTIIGHNEHTKLPSQTVFIDDIAEKRALALDTEKVAKTQKSLITSDGMNGSIWYRAKEILKKEYMDEVKKG